MLTNVRILVLPSARASARGLEPELARRGGNSVFLGPADDPARARDTDILVKTLAQDIEVQDFTKLDQTLSGATASVVVYFQPEPALDLGQGHGGEDFMVLETVGDRELAQVVSTSLALVASRRELMAAKRELTAAGAHMDAIIRAFDGLIYVCSHDYVVEFMNQAMIDRTGYDAVGEPCFKALHGLEEPCSWCVNERVRKGETVRWDIKSPKDGRWFHVVNTPIPRPDGTISKQAMIRDITERKRIEEDLKQALEERDTLLKETHHRIKNNLMAIMGLLSVEPKKFKDHAAMEIFRECRSRVRTMALIHEKLYRGSSREDLSVAQYVKSVAGYLVSTFRRKGQSVNLLLDVNDMTMDMDSAMHLGLILNELITNSLKHGFPDSDQGRIEVSLSRDDEGCLLRVADNGVGLPDEVVPGQSQETLGMQLICDLARKLGGSVEVVRAKGTETRVRFNPETRRKDDAPSLDQDIDPEARV